MDSAKILVVDDERLNRRILQVYLQEQGHTVVMAGNGQDALSILQRDGFDLVLLDLIMPKLDGYQVLKEMKGTPNLRHIPVLIISALDQMESIIRCIELGAIDYLPKPFDPILLQARIRASLSAKRAWDLEQIYAKELEEQNNELDAFARTVAHDLKSPISVVVGYASMLLEDYERFDEEPIKALLERIYISSMKSASIIDEILLLARLRKEDVDLVSLNMQIIIDEALFRLTPMIEMYEASIKVNNSWPLALGYAPWVEEVWVNYISNALKYGGSPPEVELGAHLDEAAGQVCFWVKDNGSGLTKAEQEQLFVVFNRLSESEVEGHGLGLSIVERIVQKLGGRVGVESELGAGSTFWFSLPVSTVGNSKVERSTAVLIS